MQEALGVFQTIEDIGAGTSGTVKKVLNTECVPPAVMALKVIPVALKDDVREEVLDDLRKLYSSVHPCIVDFYGVQYLQPRHVILVATEFMDMRSLKDLLRISTTIPEAVLGFCTCEILKGLVYLHRERKVIHRDIKPSNLLVNSTGRVKISDFGLSTKLANTLAPALTWVGSTTYMSPERISGLQYTWNSDVWSLGISLVECATGIFPYHDNSQEQRLELVDLLDKIVDDDPPSLPPQSFSPEFCDFVAQCLRKKSDTRPMAEMLLGHPFVVRNAGTDIVSWLASLMPHP
mmetsp:Transcript_16029/g.37799  ORF Transcript_16029/g.37799 Transcript_16029/m.37799 type:complete len:291 (+) Transcript_16029:18-890(+)